MTVAAEVAQQTTLSLRIAKNYCIELTWDLVIISFILAAGMSGVPQGRECLAAALHVSVFLNQTISKWFTQNEAWIALISFDGSHPIARQGKGCQSGWKGSKGGGDWGKRLHPDTCSQVHHNAHLGDVHFFFLCLYVCVCLCLCMCVYTKDNHTYVYTVSQSVWSPNNYRYKYYKFAVNYTTIIQCFLTFVDYKKNIYIFPPS